MVIFLDLSNLFLKFPESAVNLRKFTLGPSGFFRIFVDFFSSIDCIQSFKFIYDDLYAVTNIFTLSGIFPSNRALVDAW